MSVGAQSVTQDTILMFMFHMTLEGESFVSWQTVIGLGHLPQAGASS